MDGDLITLPLRLGVRAASLALRVTEGVAKRTLRMAGIGMPFGARHEAPAEPAAEDAEARPAEPPAAEPPVPDAEVVEDEPAGAVDAAEPDAGPFPSEPTHVSEEAVLVEEHAERGAEDGAGAQVTVEEPWEGYSQMTAKDVIARLGDADPAELAAVELYESANHARQSVLTEVARRLELSQHSSRE